MIKLPKNVLPIIFLLIYAQPLWAQESAVPEDPIVIQIIALQYADAEQLAITLEPLLSPQGRITAYGPTNSLIIKDRKSIVEALVTVIKGTSTP
jgi:type II secretory pathway component GspD/PulD (secretin)